MQLISVWVLNAFATVLVVSLVLAALTTLVTFGTRINVRRFLSFCAPVFSFCVLGFVTGQIMANSRESAVGTVVPAALTLLGGVAAFIVGSKGVRVQATVSAMVLCFALSLFVGSIFGARLRIDFETGVEEPMRRRALELAAEENRLAIETLRLENYIAVLKLRRDFSLQEKLDLSGFKIIYEQPFERSSSEEKKSK